MPNNLALLAAVLYYDIAGETLAGAALQEA
jgi:hypothetical protein